MRRARLPTTAIKRRRDAAIDAVIAKAAAQVALVAALVLPGVVITQA